MKFINKLQQFMIGRYGVDDLYNFLIKVYLVLIVINLFLNSNILAILEIVIFVIMIYRFLSKNIYKRQHENALFLKLKQRFLNPFKNMKRNITDKDHIYKKCHKCKTTLKLPLPMKRGIKIAKCPGCGKRVKLIALKKQQIEIIKKARA